MAYREFKVEKYYYTIGEVAELIGESNSLVRFWSESFPQYIKPARNKKGNRLFTADDLVNIKRIHWLVKEVGMTLEGAAKRMRDNRDGVDRRLDAVTRLNSIKEQLTQISNSL